MHQTTFVCSRVWYKSKDKRVFAMCSNTQHTAEALCCLIIFFATQQHEAHGAATKKKVKAEVTTHD
jgi:hypothetical protein